MSRPGGMGNYEVLGWMIGALVLFVHGLFIVLDGRVPPDPGGHYANLPTTWQLWVQTDRLVRLPEHVVGTMGGWYDVALAWALRMLGPSVAVFRLVHLAWLALLLWSTGALARAASGPPARAAALALCCATPAVVVLARTGWIHVPETALLVTAVVVFGRDPKLTQKRSAVLLALLGGLAAALRASSFLWLAPLALTLAWSRPRWRRAAVVMATWAVCAAPSLLTLRTYADRKLAAREHYAEVVPGLGAELWTGWGPLLLGAVGLGLLGCLRARPLSIPVRLMGAWLGVGIGVKLLLHSGLGDLTPIVIAAAVLAGVGLSALHRLAPLLPLPIFLLAIAGPWLPEAPRTAIAAVLHPGTTEPFGPLSEFDRPYRGWGIAGIRALLDATCPPGETCRVAVEQGLFYPYSDSDGSVELLFVESGPLELVNLNRHYQPLPDPIVHAMASFACGPEREADWTGRFPKLVRRVNELRQVNHLEVAWSEAVSGPCVFTWWTPRGEVARAELLPP